MNADAPCPITALRVDGGASVSDIMMQTQADLLRLPVDRPAQVETTAFGAAALAGLAAGVWGSLEEAGGPAPQPARISAPAAARPPARPSTASGAGRWTGRCGGLKTMCKQIRNLLRSVEKCAILKPSERHETEMKTISAAFGPQVKGVYRHGFF